MHASQLITELQQLVATHGDLEVMESYDCREINSVELSEYSDDKGGHDFFSITLEDEVDEDNLEDE